MKLLLAAIGAGVGAAWVGVALGSAWAGAAIVPAQVSPHHCPAVRASQAQITRPFRQAERDPAFVPVERPSAVVRNWFSPLPPAPYGGH